MQESATSPALGASALPASTTWAPLTVETLRRHNAGKRVTYGDVYSQPSIASSMWNLDYAAEDLPEWFDDEAWTVEIRPWNSSDVCMKLNFHWEKGQNNVTLGQVLHQMREKLGESFHKDAVVVLLSPETNVTAKLDHEGCYLWLREFLHKCILKQPESNDFKVSLQYHLWSSAVDEAFAVGCPKADKAEKTVLGVDVRS